MAGNNEAKVKFTADTSDFNKKIKDANSTMTELRSEMKLSEAQFKNTGDKVKYLSEKSEILKKEIEANQEKQDALNGKLETAVRYYGADSDEAKKLQTQLNNTKAAQEKLKSELDATQKELKESTDGTKEYNEAAEKMEDKTEDASGAVDALATAMIASGVVGTLKEIAGKLLDCVAAADEFETAMKKVSTIADTTVVSEEDLEAAILDQSSALAVSASDYAEATYQAMSASVDTADAVGFVADATKLAEAGFTSTTAATDVLTTALNAYGLQAGESARISDLLVTTQNLGKTSVDQLAQSLGNVLPIASTYNVDMENLSAAYVELTRNGINTAAATTDLRAMLGELGDSSKDVAKIILEKTGMSFSQLMDSGASLGDVMDILADSVDGDKDKFAELWASARTSGVAALTLLNRGSKDYNDVLKQMKNSSGAVDTAFKKMTNTSEHTSKRLKNSVNNLKIAVGKQLSPTLEKLQGTFADMIEGATKWVQENPQVVKAFTAIAIALGVIVGAVVAYTAATKIATIVQEMFNAVANSNPYILLASAILAVVAALAFFTDGFKQPETALTHMRDAANEARDAQNDLAEALQTSKENFDKSAGEIEAQAQNATYLKDQLFELINAEDQTAEDQARIAVLVERLNGLYPELNLLYDEQTNSLSMTNDELTKYIENSRKAALVEAYKERVAEESKALLEAQEKLNKAEKDYKKAAEENAAVSIKVANANRKQRDAQDRYDKALQEYDEIMADVYSDEQTRIDAQNELETAELEMNAAQEEYNRLCEENRDVLEGIGQATEDYKNTVAEANGEIDAANENLDYLIGQQNQLEDALSGTTQAVEVNTAAIEANEDSLWLSKNAVERTAQSYVEAGESIQGTADAVLESTNQMADSIRQTVDTTVQSFKDINEDGRTTIEEMIQSMREQIANVQQWEQNLATLIRYGVSEDIVQGFAAMGTAGADMVADTVEQLNTLQQTAPGQVEGLVGELNEVYGDLWALSEGENSEAKTLETAIAEQVAGGQEALTQLGVDLKQPAYDAMGYLNDGFLEGIADGQTKLNEALEEAGEEGVDSMDEGFGVNSPSWKTYQTGRFVDAGLVKGINEGKAYVLAAADQVAAGAIAKLTISQGLMIASGRNATYGLARGILDGESAVIQAAMQVAQSVVNTTQDTLDMHSPSRVMEELGALSGEGYVIGFDSYADKIADRMRSVMNPQSALESHADNASSRRLIDYDLLAVKMMQAAANINTMIVLNHREVGRAQR